MLKLKTTFFLIALLLPCMAQAASNTSAAFFPLLPLDAAPDTPASLMPLASNHALDENHQGITRGIIVIHDFSRDAGKAMSLVTTLAGAENSNSMIMAPQFLLDSDIVRFANTLPDKGKDFARWQLGGWNTGADSITTPPQKGISSFTAIDILLMYLGDKASFPDMKEITIIGHGEGGDFVQRYAAVGQGPDILAQQQVSVLFVTSNAASYLYLTAVRPRSNHQGFSPPDNAACTDYDKWPYGMNALNAYAKRAGANAIKTRFTSRQIAYLIGENAGKGDPEPDTSCAAMTQGNDRPSRAVNYIGYTGLLYGDDASKHQQLTVIPNAGYDAAVMYGSSCGMTLLFGDGDCTPPTLKPTNSTP